MTLGLRPLLALMAGVLLGLTACTDEPSESLDSSDSSTISIATSTGSTESYTPVTSATTSVPVDTSLPPGLRTFTVTDGLPTDRVLHVDTNEDGTTWVSVARDDLDVTVDVTVARLDGERWQTLDPPTRFFGRPDLTAGPEGSAWVIGDGFIDPVGLWEYDGTAWIVHIDCSPEGLAEGRCQRGASEAQGAAAGGDGELWAHGFVSEGPVVGCGYLLRDGDGWLVFQAYPLERASGGLCPIDVFAPDGHPHALVAEGLFRLDRDGWARLADTPGTPGSVDLQLVRWAVGPEGTVWTLRADPGALTLIWERFDGETWTTIPIGTEGIVAVEIDRECVLSDDPGRDPADLEAQLTDPLGRANFLNGALQPIKVDSAGGVWTAIRCSGLIRTDPDGEVTHTLTTADGLPSLRITDLDIGPSGALWVATMDGLVRLVPEQ